MHLRFTIRDLLLLTLVVVASNGADAITIDWTPIGDPGNLPDTLRMTTDGTSGYGAVGYAYNIGTYEVTNAQYAEFLNAKDPAGTDLRHLYNPEMSVFGDGGGINFNATNASGSKYSTKPGRANWPVNWVGWYSALRFANWLNNGQGNSDTETGSYTLANGSSVTRNPGAQVFLPTENEWYKAAYYNPSTASYFLYPTSTNSPPTPEAPPGGTNSANYFQALDHTTDVGSYLSSRSPYGTFDQGGNLYEWDEAIVRVGRGIRGGAYSHADDINAAYRNYSPNIDGGWFDIGFRVASVPEPDAFTLALIGAGCLIRIISRGRTFGANANSGSGTLKCVCCYNHSARRVGSRIETPAV